MADVQLNWTAPTEFDDGTTLDPTNDLSGYIIEYYVGAINNGVTQISVLGGNTLTRTINGLPDALLGFAVISVAADGTNGGRTEWTAVDATNSGALPAAPGGLQVTIL